MRKGVLCSCLVVMSPILSFAVEMDYRRVATANSFRVEKLVYRYIRQYEDPCLYIELLNPAESWHVVYTKKICAYDSKDFYSGYAFVEFGNFMVKSGSIKFDMKLVTLPPVTEKNLKCLIPLENLKIEDLQCIH